MMACNTLICSGRVTVERKDNDVTTEDLKRFFDCYLKGVENDWKKTPRVRMSVLDPGGEDIVHRPENEFPPARTRYRRLFLDAENGRMTSDPPANTASVRYRSDDDRSTTAFTITFSEETEITGHMVLHLWVEADGADDMDLFVVAEKLDKDADRLQPIVKGAPFSGFDGAPVEWGTGRLRVSHRRCAASQPPPALPFHLHTGEQRLHPGEIVPVEIELCPMSMRWHAGQKLRVLIAGYNMEKPQFEELPPIRTRNRGTHIIHTGGKYDSSLWVPVTARALL